MCVFFIWTLPFTPATYFLNNLIPIRCRNMCIKSNVPAESSLINSPFWFIQAVEKSHYLNDSHRWEGRKHTAQKCFPMFQKQLVQRQFWKKPLKLHYNNYISSLFTDQLKRKLYIWLCARSWNTVTNKNLLSCRSVHS